MNGVLSLGQDHREKSQLAKSRGAEEHRSVRGPCPGRAPSHGSVVCSHLVVSFPMLFAGSAAVCTPSIAARGPCLPSHPEAESVP